MTIDDLLAYQKKRYIRELAPIYGVKEITLYRWSSKGIPMFRQRKFAKDSNGILKVEKN